MLPKCTLLISVSSYVTSSSSTSSIVSLLTYMMLTAVSNTYNRVQQVHCYFVEVAAHNRTLVYYNCLRNVATVGRKVV